MKRFTNILCIVEPENFSETALTQALNIATNHQAKITVACFIKPLGPWKTWFKTREDFNSALSHAAIQKKQALEAWVGQSAPSEKIDVVVGHGTLFIEAIQRVIAHQHDLVIKCSDDIDWLDRLFGTDDMHLLRKCPCPVLMLKPGQSEPFKRVLAAVDVSDDEIESDEAQSAQESLNLKILDYASLFSVDEFTDLHVVSIWQAYAESFLRDSGFAQLPDDEVNKYVEDARLTYAANINELLDAMKKSVGEKAFSFIRPQKHLIKGDAAKEIPVQAKALQTDLIVMGTVARTGIPGLIIGNTAESILEQVHCSVLAVKPDHFHSPVETP